MTVLALFHDLGLAFSDVMLSVEEPGRHLKMPTTGYTGNLNSKLPLSPTRLVRKFFRISHRGKNGVFLVAGTVAHIERLVHNITLVKDQSNRLPGQYLHRLDNSDVHSVLHVACVFTEDEGFPDFEMLGVIDEATFARQVDANRALGEAPYFGSTRLAGSGGQDLYRWIYERGEQYAQRDLAHESIESKIQRTIHLVPSLLLEEDTRDTLSTISKGVGGYYESYYLGKDTIEPLDSVLTIFAAIKGKGSNSFLELRRVFYHRYVSDWLLVLSMFDLPAHVRPGVEQSFPFSQFELFKIPPLLCTENAPNWTVSRLAIGINTAENFRLTLYREEENERKISKRFAEGSSGKRLMHTNVANNSVTMSIRPSEFEHFLERFSSRDQGNEAITVAG
jgi:hypothetical protein